MAQQAFPLDPVQTQITKPVTNVAARPVAPPQQTGLSQGLAVLGQAIGAAADVAKARRFAEELQIAELDAARGKVSPGLVSQKAINLNRRMIDENFSTDLINQINVWARNGGSNIANDVSRTKLQKAAEIKATLNTYREQLGFITNSGDALLKAQQAIQLAEHELYTSIGQFDLQTVLQEGTKYGKQKLEAIANNPDANFNIGVAKGLIKEFHDLETEHPFRMVDGKKVKVAADWDERKAVFSLMASTVTDHFNDRPELFYQFETIIKDFYQPLANQESALNVQGKADTIGDNTTLQSLIDGYYSKLNALHTAKANEEKDSNERWVSATLLRYKIANKNLREIDPNQQAEILTHYNGNIYAANKAIAEGNKYLKGAMWNIYTPKFYGGLKHILEGRLVDEQQIELWGLNNQLSPDAITGLKTDLTEKRKDIQDNINILKDQTPVFTWARISKALTAAKKSEYIATKLQKLGINLTTAVSFTQLQGVVAGANNLKGIKDIIDPLKTVQDFMRTTEELRTKLARQAAYRNDKLGRDVSDVTKADIDKFTKERFERFNAILKTFTELVDVAAIEESIKEGSK